MKSSVVVKPSILIAGIAVFSIIIAAFVVLTVTNHPTEFFVQLLTVQLVPAVAAILGLINYRKITQVQSNTDGTASQLTQINAQAVAALSNSVPVDAIISPATAHNTKDLPTLPPVV